jgi:hypothetical protein
VALTKPRGRGDIPGLRRFCLMALSPSRGTLTDWVGRTSRSSTAKISSTARKLRSDTATRHTIPLRSQKLSAQQRDGNVIK